MRLEVTVDEVVLRGLGTHEARVAAAALEARLTALAGDPEARLAARDEAFRRLPPLRAASAAGLGVAVAEAVWGALATGGAP